MAGIIVFVVVAFAFFMGGMLTIALSPVVYDVVTRETETNYSLQFTSSSAEYVNVTDSATLDIGTSDLSIVARVKVTSFNGTDQTIVAKRDTGAATNPGYKLSIDGTSRLLTASIADSTGLVTKQGATALTAGIWYHVAAIYDRDGLLTLYVEAVSDGTQSIAGNQGTIANAKHLHIGKTPAGASQYFNGQTDDLFIFNRILVPAEIQSLYIGGYLSNNLVSFWNFNDGSGTSLADFAGSNDGTLINTPQWSLDTAPTSIRTRELLSNSAAMVEAGFDDTYESLYNIWHIAPLLFFFATAIFAFQAIRRRGQQY